MSQRFHHKHRLIKPLAYNMLGDLRKAFSNISAGKYKLGFRSNSTNQATSHNMTIMGWEDLFRNLLKEVSLSVCSKSQIENDVIADAQSTAIRKNHLADSRIPRSLDRDLICGACAPMSRQTGGLPRPDRTPVALLSLNISARL